jgi:ankyrin repeat protein
MNKIELSFLASGLVAALVTQPCFAGTERGGGDPLALEFKATAEVALKNLQSMNGAPFSSVNITQLQSKINSAQILISDQALSVSQGGVTQDGAAENRPNQNMIIINRTDYQKIGNAVVEQALALHEFLSLEGLESTGKYPISGQYLIALGGATPKTSTQKIGSATKSIATQTLCAEPNTDASMLFSMIADSGTSPDAIKSYLQNHIVAVNAVNDQCETSFDYSIDRDRTDAFGVLFNQYHPDLNAVEMDGHFSIYAYTVGHGSLNSLHYLQNLASSNHQQLSLQPIDKNWTELMIAAESNPYVDVIQYFIQAGQSVNASGGFPLMLAAQYNPSVAVTQALIKAGAYVNATDGNGATPLVLALKKNASMDEIQALIQAGAYVNGTANVSAPLMVAAQYASLDTVQALLKAGADVNAADESYTYLHTALLNAVQFNPDTAVAKALIRAGANVNVMDKDTGMTPLMWAASTIQDITVTQALLQAGANTNTVKKPWVNVDIYSEPSTALMFATQSNSNPAVARALLQAGAAVNSTNDHGQTALMFAIHGDWNTIEILVQAGADLQIKDSDGYTALDLAKNTDLPQSILSLLGG